jgi:hypothetical protein
MADDLPAGDGSPASPGTPASTGEPTLPPRRSFFRQHWGKLTALLLVALPVAVFAIWSAVALSYTYSSGKRAGYVQKISRKGWLCKTWEGTLYTDIARGFRSDSFAFTVRDDSLAHEIERLSGKRVAVEYDQHVGVPSRCFGETEYFVVGVEELPPQ